MIQYIAQEDIDKAEKEITPSFGPLGSVVDYRTYRRWIPEQKRRETFFERNARVVNYNISLAEGLQSKEELEKEAKLFYEYLNNLWTLPSGRTMWVGGTKTSQSHPACNFNCSFTAINRVESFCQLQELLMLGTGVGFRVFYRDIDLLPDISGRGQFIVGYKSYNPVSKADRLEETNIKVTYSGQDTEPPNLCKWEVIVGDSREGWIEAHRILLNLYFGQYENLPEYVTFNFDNIRPIGERIYGFGGTASGPEALRDILFNTQMVMTECPGNRLRSIDCMDICTGTAKGVIAGSSRRSALICLFEEGDDLCANSKVNLFTDPTLVSKQHRIQSNNTECLGSSHLSNLRTFLESNPDASLESIVEFTSQFRPSLKWFQDRFKLIAEAGDPGFNNILLMAAKRWLAVRQYRPETPIEEIWEKYCDVGTNP